VALWITLCQLLVDGPTSACWPSCQTRAVEPTVVVQSALRRCGRRNQLRRLAGHESGRLVGGLPSAEKNARQAEDGNDKTGDYHTGDHGSDGRLTAHKRCCRDPETDRHIRKTNPPESG